MCCRSFSLASATFAALAGLVAAPLHAAPDDGAALERATLEAIRELTAGRHAEAISRLSLLAKPSPRVDALVGLIALAANERRAARDKLERAIARGSRHPRIIYWTARAALANGELQLASRRAREAAAAAPTDPVIQMGQALIAKQSGRLAEAHRALSEAARNWANLRDPRLYPTAVEGAIELVRELLSRGRYRAPLERALAHARWQVGAHLGACEAFAALHKARADDGDALQMLSRCAALEGDPQRARDLARAAVRSAPLLASARATLGTLLLREGKTAAAIVELRRAADARPKDAELLLQLAQACDAAQQKACARRFYRFALRQNPKLAKAFFGLALLAQGEGKTAIANQLITRAINLAPHDPRALEAGAVLRRLTGDKKAARRLARLAASVRTGRGRLSSRLARLRKPFSKLLQALKVCRCSTSCKGSDKACLGATSAIDPTARRFFHAHLALRSKRHARATALLRGVLPRLRARTLLIENCKSFSMKLRLTGTIRPEVRKTLLMVSPQRLP